MMGDMDSIVLQMLGRGDNVRERRLWGEDQKFKARHVVTISICTGEVVVGHIIFSPQHSKDDGISPFILKCSVVL